MVKQKGAALVVVLSLLTMSLMIGFSSIQSSMVDERMAGNQKLASEMQMAAEKAVAEGYSRVSESGSGSPGVLQYLLRGECSIEDLFLEINDENGDGDVLDDRNDITWSSIDDKVLGWGDLLNEDGEPCDSYDESWIAERNAVLDPDYDEPEFSGDLYAGLGEDVCDAPIQCVYRYLSVGSHRYVVGVAAYFNEDGDVVAESRPVYVDMEINDPPPNLDWIFSAAPISLLAYIGDLSVNGANNMTLDGGEHPDIMAHGGNAEALDSGFNVDTGDEQFDPEVCNLPGTDQGHGDGTCAVSEDDDFASPDSFVEVLQTLFEASGSSDHVNFVTEDPDMSNYSEGILIVGDSFTWNGDNDFNGTIIVLGPTIDYNGGGSGDLYGSMIHAPLKLTNPNYDWLDEDEYVDFSKVESFEVGDWRFLEEGDTVATNFDFNGGGGSTLSNDAEAQMEAADELWGAVASADFLTWESD